MSDLDAFAAHLRHELRTPINAILGYSQLLLEEEDGSRFSAPERHELERVADAGRQLLRVVSEVPEPIDLPAHVPEYLARLRHEMRLPLTTARNHVETLLDGHHDGAPGEDLRRIQSALTCLAALVDTAQHPAGGPGGADSGEPLAACIDTGAAERALEAGAKQETTAGTILVIDDEEANRALLARRLTRHGHVVDRKST